VLTRAGVSDNVGSRARDNVINCASGTAPPWKGSYGENPFSSALRPDQVRPSSLRGTNRAEALIFNKKFSIFLLNVPKARGNSGK
jgi:hypothetical protein